MFNKLKKKLQSGDKRSAMLKKNIVETAAVKVMSILTGLLLVPLTIGYINSELYGIWLTLSSIIHWISFFDIGFGNGLRNKLAVSLALGKNKLGKIYVSTTYFIVSAIFISIALVGCCLVPLISWHSALNVSSMYEGVLVDVARIIILTFSFQIILKLLQNVAQAYQMQSLASLLDMLGTVVSLIGIYILTITTLPDLRYVALIFTISPVLVLLIASVFFFKGKFQSVSPSIQYIKMRYVDDLLSLGGKFFIIQLNAIILFQATNFLISHCAGPESVTIYNVAYKYLSISLMVVTIILAPIWSAFTDAYTKKDIRWMNDIHRKLMKLGVLAVLGIILMTAISSSVYRLWLGESVNVTWEVSIAIAVYLIIYVIANILTTILNGIGKVKLQLYSSVFAVLLFFPLAFGLGHIWGVTGIVVSQTLVMIPSAVLGYIQVNRVLSGKAIGYWDQ